MINDFSKGLSVGRIGIFCLITKEDPITSETIAAPIHGDTEKGELIYTPTYYYIGHFSKFIRPGAKRIGTVNGRSHLLSTTFQNEDNGRVTVVMNQSDEPIDYKLFMGAAEAIALSIPACDAVDCDEVEE